MALKARRKRWKEEAAAKAIVDNFTVKLDDKLEAYLLN